MESWIQQRRLEGMRMFEFTSFTLSLVTQGWLLGPVLMFALVNFVVSLIIMTFVFYIAGLIVVGRERALFSESLRDLASRHDYRGNM